MIDQIRDEFPFLNTNFSEIHDFHHNGRIIYFDSAATALKPQCVIDAITEYNSLYPANVHRGSYWSSLMASEKYEESREIVARFLNCKSQEILFTSGTTESFNLITNGFFKNIFDSNSVIYISELEHHANMVPWQMIRDQIGCELQFIKTIDGKIDLDDLENRIDKTRKGMISLSHASNVNGSILDIDRASQIARQNGYFISIDGAQYIPHRRINLSNCDIDFYAFSGHKIFGPTGIGVLYIKEQLIDKIKPIKGGGGAIESVTLDETNFLSDISKFEAGTPNIEGAIGLGSAIEWLNSLNPIEIEEHEIGLYSHLIESLKTVNGIEFLMLDERSIGTVSFRLKGKNNYDVAEILNQFGICVRIGKHCAHPFHNNNGFESSIRVSLSLYNTKSEINYLIYCLERCRSLLS